MLVIVGHILLNDVRKIVEIRVVKKSKTEKNVQRSFEKMLIRHV